MKECKRCNNPIAKKETYCTDCIDALNNELEESEIVFTACDECDLPDACADFGCAIKAGIKKIP